MQLRVDVEAARAREQFDRTARSVENLAGELDDAEDQASAARGAFNLAAAQLGQVADRAQAADERLEELRSTARAMGNAMPQDLRDELRRVEQQSRDLNRQLDRGTTALQQMGRAANEAEDEAARLADELDDARREAERLARAMNDADANARGLGRALQRGLVGAGRSSAMQFMAEFGPAAVVAAPLVAAALEAALVTAIAGGTLGAGVALAIKSSSGLQNAFGDIFAGMGHDAQEAAAVFVEPLLAAAREIEDAWDGAIGDGLADAFSAVAPYVDDVTEGLLSLVENALPGFLSAVEAGGPLLGDLSGHLAKLGDALSSFFDSLADGEGSAKGLAVIMALLSESIRFLGNTIEFLSDSFDFLTEAGEKVGNVLGVIDPGAKLLGETLGALNDSAAKTSEIIDLYGDAATAAEYPQVRMAEAAERAATAAQGLSEKLHSLISDQLSAQQAAIAWEAAIDKITESLQENGRNLDIGTEKGRQNTQAVLAAVSAAEQKRQAAINLAGGEKASADAVAAANAEFNKQIGQLAATLRQAGLTEEQIRTLLGTYQTFANQGDIYKTITVDRKVLGPALGPAFGFRGLASGTDSAKRGWTVVGEEGPEIVFMQGGERVLNARQTAQAIAGSPGGSAGRAGGGVMQAQLVVSGDGSASWLYQAVAKGVREGDIRLVVVNGEVRPG